MIDIDKALLVFEKKDPDVMIIAHQYRIKPFKSGYYHYKQYYISRLSFTVDMYRVSSLEEYFISGALFVYFILLIINNIDIMQFRENSGDFIHRYEDSRSGNQTERKSGYDA